MTCDEKTSFIWSRRDWFYVVQTILMLIPIIRLADMPYHRSAWIFYIGLANMAGKDTWISLSLDMEIYARNYKEIVSGQ